MCSVAFTIDDFPHFDSFFIVQVQAYLAVKKQEQGNIWLGLPRVSSAGVSFHACNRPDLSKMDTEGVEPSTSRIQ